MAEAIACFMVLLFALYGVGCLLYRLTLRILRPEQEVARFSVAYLRQDTQNCEQIVRYFRAKADKREVLLLVDNGVADNEKEVVRRLCDTRRDVRLLDAQNFVEENCIYGEDAL